MTKKEIVESIWLGQEELTKAECKVLVEKVFSTIYKSLVEKQENVNIRGFGSFKVVDRKSRVGVSNFQKGTINVPAHKAVHFRPSNKVKETLFNKTKEI